MEEDNRNPSEVTDDFWLYVWRQKGSYPEMTERGGKWLVFVSKEEVDSLWEIIKQAVRDGKLGGVAKVATSRPNPIAVDKNTRVICVYTYDYEDREDIMRIREVLRGLGVVEKIPYKTDKATRERKYAIKGDKNVSLFWD